MEVWLVWLARLMFLGIFAIAGGMFFRAWRIAIRGDLRYVADWRGRVFPDGERWKLPVSGVNLLGAACLLGVAASVLMAGVPFTLWSGLVALVLWGYYFTLQLLLQWSRRPAA